MLFRKNKLTKSLYLFGGLPNNLRDKAYKCGCACCLVSRSLISLDFNNIRHIVVIESKIVYYLILLVEPGAIW